MKKTFNNFTITTERNWYTNKTMVQLDNGQVVYRCSLKVGSEKEVINDMIKNIGTHQPTYKEAKEYFDNHKERN